MILKTFSYGSLKKRDISLKHFVSTPVFSDNINYRLSCSKEVSIRLKLKLLDFSSNKSNLRAHIL